MYCKYHNIILYWSYTSRKKLRAQDGYLKRKPFDKKPIAEGFVRRRPYNVKNGAVVYYT